MDHNKTFHRNVLTTAIIMALSAPVFAIDSTISSESVTLDKDKTNLDKEYHRGKCIS